MDLYQFSQRKRVLSALAWVILVAALVLGILNIQYKTWLSVISLFSLVLLCVLVIILNSYNHYTIAGILLSFNALIAISLSMYDGDGILDAGILAFPIFIVFGALLFGKRFIPFLLLGSVVSIFALIYLEINGYVHPTIHPARFKDSINIIIILLIAALVVWIIMYNYEKNLLRARSSEAELSRTYDLTLEAWAQVLEYRDRETAGHSSRLVELGTRLAEAIKCSEEEIKHLQRGALLHDIGKLAIPDSVLLKPAKLDDEELEIIKKHPAYGKEMLSGVPFLEASIPVVYCHHEHWNGKGYPQGLEGEQIPLLARIFSIVDCWDALNSDRPYRLAWPRDEIISYIKNNAGIIYDPNIVEKFLQII